MVRKAGHLRLGDRHGAVARAADTACDPAQAEQTLSGYLQFVIHQLEGLDPLLEDIDIQALGQGKIPFPVGLLSSSDEDEEDVEEIVEEAN